MITEFEKLLIKEVKQKNEIIKQLKVLVADLEKQLKEITTKKA
jgi:hypothetical protein